MNKKIAIHDRICAEIHEMYKKKNADYGDSVGELYKKLGDVSFLTRISDKYHRLMNLMCDNDGYMKKEIDMNYESIEDTIQDLANYCIIWLMEKEFKKEEENKNRVVYADDSKMSMYDGDLSDKEVSSPEDVQRSYELYKRIKQNLKKY